MNKLLFVLSVSFITALAADDESNIAQLQKRSWANNEASTVQECPAPKPCCKEKCCPCPKPPVCCECFVPSYYDLQCDSGVVVSADFLFWYANEDNLSPCLTGRATNIVSSSSSLVSSLAPIKENHLNTKWDPGYRVALGYNFDHDGWDTLVTYTWYQNKKSHVFSVPSFGTSTYANFPVDGQLALVDPWFNPAIFTQSTFFFLFDRVNSRWKLNFNQFDWELGRKFWLGKYTALRTFAGVRGAWFTTKFNNVASANINFTSITNFLKYSDNFKDSIWGVGLLGGIQPEWHFCRNFILFSNIDMALLWGKIRVRKKEDYTGANASGLVGLNYHNIFTNSFYQMEPVLDLAIGLRWEETWCYKVRTYLDLGWEHHVWFDVNHRIKFNNPSEDFNSGTPSTEVNGYLSYDDLEGNLMMGGLVVRFRADF